MGEKQEKVTVIKWMLPSLFLLIAFVILLVNFSVSGQKKAVAEVDAKMIRMVEDYAESVSTQIVKMTTVGTPMAALLADVAPGDVGETLKITRTLAGYSSAYLVAVADKNGKGITNTGARVDMKAEPYFLKDDGKQHYVYTEKENITGANAIVTVIPISKESRIVGSLYLYFPLTKANELFSGFSLYTHSVMLLTLGDGRIVTQAGRDMSFIGNHTNLKALIKDSSAAGKEKELEGKIDNLDSGRIASVVRDKEEKYVAYVPLKINDWYISVGINENYITKQVALAWKDTRGIMMALIVIVCAFVFTVIAISVVMRIRYSQHSKTLATKADTDLLTDLYNKMATEREIKDYLRNKPNARAIMFVLDIDNFKKINDTRGHAFGDEVLKAIGVRLQTAFRVSDIVGRTGGDEFTVFLKDISDEAVVEKEMRKLTNVFKDFNTGEYVKYSVTASIGCALYPQDANTFETLYKASDSALYIAKKRGKNQIARYEKSEACEKES